MSCLTYLPPWFTVGTTGSTSVGVKKEAIVWYEPKARTAALGLNLVEGQAGLCTIHGDFFGSNWIKKEFTFIRAVWCWEELNLNCLFFWTIEKKIVINVLSIRSAKVLILHTGSFHKYHNDGLQQAVLIIKTVNFLIQTT